MWACSMTRRGGYQAEVLWNSTASSAINAKAPSQMKDYRDLAGGVNPIVNGTVPVQNLPILLETGPIPPSRTTNSASIQGGSPIGLEFI